MAIREFDATMAPQDLVAALSLTDGSSYTVQNVSTTATLFLRPAPTLAAGRAFKVEAGGNVVIGVVAGEVVGVWTDDEDGCPLVLDDVP